MLEASEAPRGYLGARTEGRPPRHVRRISRGETSATTPQPDTPRALSWRGGARPSSSWRSACSWSRPHRLAHARPFPYITPAEGRGHAGEPGKVPIRPFWTAQRNAVLQVRLPRASRFRVLISAARSQPPAQRSGRVPEPRSCAGHPGRLAGFGVRRGRGHPPGTRGLRHLRVRVRGGHRHRDAGALGKQPRQRQPSAGGGAGRRHGELASPGGRVVHQAHRRPYRPAGRHHLLAHGQPLTGAKWSDLAMAQRPSQSVSRSCSPSGGRSTSSPWATTGASTMGERASRAAHRHLGRHPRHGRQRVNQGMIGCVGLVIPHFARMIVTATTASSCPPACSWAPACSSSTTTWRANVASSGIPIGILTAFVERCSSCTSSRGGSRG